LVDIDFEDLPPSAELGLLLLPSTFLIELGPEFVPEAGFC